MTNLNCVFSEPIDLDPLGTADFEFTKITCSNTNLELITNPNTNAEFYLDKSLNYGEILILVFLLLFVIFGITKAITDFFIPRRITKF